MTIIHHENKDYTICVTDDGYGTATINFLLGLNYDKDADEFTQEPQAEISNVSIYLEQRNKGYGNLLLDECENLAKQAGYKEVYLWSKINSEAYVWYKRHGYEETNEMAYIPRIEGSEAIVRLRKILN